MASVCMFVSICHLLTAGFQHTLDAENTERKSECGMLESQGYYHAPLSLGCLMIKERSHVFIDPQSLVSIIFLAVMRLKPWW